jgi:hypothetical protein
VDGSRCLCDWWLSGNDTESLTADHSGRLGL